MLIILHFEHITIGILGLFDPASKLGFEKLDKEDYGQTLATWGVGEGCYIVLPCLLYTSPSPRD